MNPSLIALLLGGGFLWAMSQKKRKRSGNGIVVFDVYPSSRGPKDVQIVPTKNAVTHSSSCEIIAVGHGWWDQVAKPVAQATQGADHEEITLKTMVATLPECADKATDALNELYEELLKKVQRWVPDADAISLSPQPKKAGFQE